jgi:hypothetical protein
MAIAYDNATHATSTGVNSTSFTHVIGAGATLAAFWAIQDGGASGISTVSIGGVSGSLVVGQNGGGFMRCEMWIVASPPSGSQTVSITLPGTGTYGYIALTITGSATTVYNSASKGAGSGVSTDSISVTTSTNNDWILEACATSDVDATVGSSQTIRDTVIPGRHMQGATHAIATAGANTETWSWGATNINYAIVGAAITTAPPVVFLNRNIISQAVKRGSFY